MWKCQVPHHRSSDPQLALRACALEFTPCVIMDELDELRTLGEPSQISSRWHRGLKLRRSAPIQGMVLSPSQEDAWRTNRTLCLDMRPSFMQAQLHFKCVSAASEVEM